jgi:hypothetical protein
VYKTGYRPLITGPVVAFRLQANGNRDMAIGAPLVSTELNDQTSAKVLSLPSGGHSAVVSRLPPVTGQVSSSGLQLGSHLHRPDKMRSNDSFPTVVHFDIWVSVMIGRNVQ